jgi:hypothetical protein
MPPSFRREDLLNFSQSETIIAHVDHPFGMKLAIFIEDLVFSFGSDWKTNMATMGNSCLFMLDLYAMITLFNFNSDLCEHMAILYRISHTSFRQK